MNTKLSLFSRIAAMIAGLSLVAVLFVPIWRIDLDAPQYPEGLALKIHANDIKGDVDIINGLNHYIGMKTLHKEDFPEFTVLPYCIVFFAALFLITGIVNRKKLLYIAFTAFVLFGIIAMADFWKWEYNYGHNLNPNAAIVVPGMAYQPPLIGFKQLLNFGAYSIPDTGGWIFIGAGVLMLLGVVIELRLKGIARKKMQPAAMAAVLIMLLASCSIGPEPLRAGKDNCAFCKMTISDLRFGAELVTSTGKKYKFDDIHCMMEFAKGLETIAREEAHVYLADYTGNHDLIEADKCQLLQGSEIKCPMQGRLVAFSSMDSLHVVMSYYKGQQTTWARAK